MARRKINLYVEISNEKEFENVLRENCKELICAEVYNHFAGSCTSLDRLFTTIKLDWSDGRIILLKVPADEIEVFKRFRDHSEPVYLFILNKRITKMLRGVDAIRLAEVAKKELYYFKMEESGCGIDRRTYSLDEPTPEETELTNALEAERQVEEADRRARLANRQAARKRHRAELMEPFLRHLNFVLFWPHATRAHPELYEHWDANNIIMIGREEVLLDEEKARDVLYAGDAPVNEASMHKLLSGPALAICFRILDTDKNFVALVRSILYEKIPEYDETKPIKDQPPRKTAFDLYKSFSPSREEVWRKRREDRKRRKQEEIERRARRLSEMQRLARQAQEEALEAQRAEKERKKLEILKSGNLSALDKLANEVDEEIVIEIPKELPEEYKEESSDEEEDENEYFPPPGLLIPGFYAPPNEIAKVNGLAILFPKLVFECVNPETEYLPPHVLVMLNISQRHAAVEAMQKYKKAIIHMGIFKATTPYNATHIAYTVRHYDELNLYIDVTDVKLMFMLSVERDIPLLVLMDFTPLHVSRDTEWGEEECAAVFPVDYADNYPQFEDFGDMRVLKMNEKME